MESRTVVTAAGWLGKLTVIGRALDGEPGRWDSDLMTQAAKHNGKR